MKMILLAICVMLLGTLAAQDSTTIFIDAGRNVSEVLVPARIYQLPKFVEGTILYRDGTFSKGMLNHNFLNGEIEFINPKNDTLAIAKNQMLNIKQVSMDKQTFFYDHGYMELVAKTALGKLTKKQMFVVTKREKIGGYNQPSSTSAIESYGSFTDNYGNFFDNLKIKENITLTLKSYYFISDGYNVFLPASKKNMMDLYHSKRNAIAAYLKKTQVNFKNGEDLKKMFESL